MTRLLGGMILAVCAATAGFAARNRLAERVALLRGLCDALAALERELAFRLTPLPRLFEGLARQSPRPVGEFFAACAAGTHHLDAVPLSETWQQAMGRTLVALTDEEARVMHTLGAVLGRYDGEGQRAALGEATARLEGYIARADEQRARLGKVYSALGVTAGLFFLILIL